MQRLRSRALALGLTVATIASLGVAAPTQAAARTYYVDCSAGADSRAGTSPATAWRTIGRANQASLAPGDSLLFKRGCTWSGQKLQAKWNGTATARIKIGAYGTGGIPIIKNGGSADIAVKGSYQVIEQIHVTFDPKTTVACNQPIGEYYGIVFNEGGHHNTVQNVTASAATAGVHMSKNSSKNKVLRSTLVWNNVLTSFGPNPAKDLGAWGILIRSNDNEIAYNLFQENAAICSNQGYKLMSNSVEIYEGSRNSIHHNRSVGDRVFSELGSSASVKATGNSFAYNLFISGRADSRFIVTRGGGDASFGPVNSTLVQHNTTYQTGPRSQSIVCILGCSSQVLVARSNVLWAEEKVLYADKPFTFQDGVVWNSAGTPTLQVGGGQSYPGLAVANPMFTDAARGNFSPRAGSPAIDRATTAPGWANDLVGTAIPQYGRFDAGSLEFRG